MYVRTGFGNMRKKTLRTTRVRSAFLLYLIFPAQPDGIFRFGKIDDIACPGIDHAGVAALAFAPELIGIVLVDVSVNKQRRAVLVHQLLEHGKSAMGKVGLIAHALNGGVSNQDIESFGAP